MNARRCTPQIVSGYTGGIVRLRAAFLLAAALWIGGPATAEDITFRSASLGRDMPYRVLLPAGYVESARRYPVLYLLHGLDGHFVDWTTRTKLARHVAALDLIVVTPEGANSWYVNWHGDTSERWEDYLARDLIADVDARFRTDARREARFIAGLSMGGYGAVRMGLKHPDLFSAAASLSGALNVTRLETYGWTDPLRAQFARAFGPIGSRTRATDDVFELAKRADSTGLPFFYIDCGADDPFLPGNRELAAILQQRRIPYEYRETPGAHNWPYWDRQVVEILRGLPLR
jgi:S-formylglutathione hydrolase FrmB